MRLDDWLPSLLRASTWNEWTEDELLLQFAGHLRGRALQEWALLSTTSKETYSATVESLRARLDPGSRALAAQDFVILVRELQRVWLPSSGDWSAPSR